MDEKRYPTTFTLLSLLLFPLLSPLRLLPPTLLPLLPPPPLLLLLGIPIDVADLDTTAAAAAAAADLDDVDAAGGCGGGTGVRGGNVKPMFFCNSDLIRHHGIERVC